MTGRHVDDDGNGIADHAEIERCDERPRDDDGQLLDGHPEEQ